jgi:hypothetical protein
VRARDQPTVFVSPGPIYTPSSHPSHTPAGIGGEMISSVYYGDARPGGYGPLVQGEWLPAGDLKPSTSQFEAAMQGVIGPFGLEAGWAAKTDGGTHAPWATGPCRWSSR